MSIEGKVAAILNERELVINKGAEAGVKLGVKFRVMEPERSIKDPETGETLGLIRREKIRVKIGDVQPRYSIGRTYETYVVNVGGQGMSFTLDFLRRGLPRQEVTRVRTLRADGATRFEPIDDESSFVKVGDPVVEIEGDL